MNTAKTAYMYLGGVLLFAFLYFLLCELPLVLSL